MDNLIIFFITLTSFLLGYFIGRGEKINTPLIVETIKKKIKMNQVKPGPLMRPSLKQLDRRENKKLYEGVDATKEILDKIFQP